MAIGGIGAALVANPAFGASPTAAGEVVGANLSSAAAEPLAAEAEPLAVEPLGGAGLFDIDPDQGDVSQDPNVVLTGDVSGLPEDWEF